jgi:hypothetical protein
MKTHLILLKRCPEVPVIQVAASDTEVGSKAEPTQVRSKKPSTDRIDLAPNVGKIANSTAKSEDVGSCSDWTAHGKVQGSPDQVQGELNAVKGGTLLGESDSLRVDGGGASSPRTVSRVAHGGIECGPYWSENVARWVKRWLLQRPVLLLRVASCKKVRRRPNTVCKDIVRLMENPTAVPQATGSRIAAAGFEKRKLGSVKEGM